MSEKGLRQALGLETTTGKGKASLQPHQRPLEVRGVRLGVHTIGQTEIVANQAPVCYQKGNKDMHANILIFGMKMYTRCSCAVW